MSSNGDGFDHDASVRTGAPAKLTLGQRILASLPNLERRPRTAPPPRRSAGRAPHAASGTDVVVADAVLEPARSETAVGPGAGGRDASLPATSKAGQPDRGAVSGMTKDELVAIIKKLDERERVLALLSAPIGVVVGVVLTIGAVHYNPGLHQKGHLTTGTIYLEGGARVLLSAIVLLAAWTRRRSFVAFALLFLGTSLGFPFALPFWALGVWFIFRVFKWQKELSAMTGGASRQRATPAARGRTDAEARGRARAEARAARGRGRGAKTQTDATGPSQSKRYTPPKPTRTRPPAQS